MGTLIDMICEKSGVKKRKQPGSARLTRNEALRILGCLESIKRKER